MTYLARGDFAGLGYGNYQAKSRAYSDVEARQALAYDALHSLESIWVCLKLTSSKIKSTSYISGLQTDSPLKTIFHSHTAARASPNLVSP